MDEIDLHVYVDGHMRSVHVPRDHLESYAGKTLLANGDRVYVRQEDLTAEDREAMRQRGIDEPIFAPGRRKEASHDTALVVFACFVILVVGFTGMALRWW